MRNIQFKLGVLPTYDGCTRALLDDGPPPWNCIGTLILCGFVPLSILTISILEGFPLVSPTIMQLVFRHHLMGYTLWKLFTSL